MRFPSDRVEAWIPYSTIPDASIPRIRPVRVLDVVARVKDGVTLAQASQDINSITRRLAATYPEDASWSEATVMPLPTPSPAMSGEASSPCSARWDSYYSWPV
jgi:hypothetical protein